MQPSIDESRVGFILEGRVQAVGFRWWARRSATRLGVRGTVRNRADGSVELHAAGPADALQTFVDALRTGPPGARVDVMRPIQSTTELPADFRAIG
jgi:acylphosphatase